MINKMQEFFTQLWWKNVSSFPSHEETERKKCEMRFVSHTHEKGVMCLGKFGNERKGENQRDGEKTILQGGGKIKV